ncbi:unnamed protein product, partial [Symbiodinium necroappetens]
APGCFWLAQTAYAEETPKIPQTQLPGKASESGSLKAKLWDEIVEERQKVANQKLQEALEVDNGQAQDAQAARGAKKNKVVRAGSKHMLMLPEVIDIECRQHGLKVLLEGINTQVIWMHFTEDNINWLKNEVGAEIFEREYISMLQVESFLFKKSKKWRWLLGPPDGPFARLRWTKEGWHIDSLVPMEESLSLWFNGAADSMEPPTKGWKFWCKGNYKKSCISFEEVKDSKKIHMVEATKPNEPEHPPSWARAPALLVPLMAFPMTVLAL